MKDRRCAATNARGQPCAATIVLSSGYCRAHDPAHAEERKRAASRNGLPARDPEMAEIRAGLKNLVAVADKPGADLERVQCLITLARARIYAAKADSDIARHAAEVRELEDAYDTLLSDYEALRDGKPTSYGPEGWYERRGARE